MTKKDELLEQLGESYGYVEKLIDNRLELAKLKLAEKSARVVSGLIVGLVLSAILLLVITCLIIAAGFALAQWTGSVSSAFVIVAVVLIALGILLFVFSTPLVLNPVISTFLSSIYSEKDEQNPSSHSLHRRPESPANGTEAGNGAGQRAGD